jgi:predicted amidohydrolase YtcJ
MVVKDGKFITVGRITKTKLPIGDYTNVVDFDGQLPCAG